MNAKISHPYHHIISPNGQFLHQVIIGLNHSLDINFKLCIQRLTSYNWMNYAPQSLNCSNNLTACGTGNEMFCVPKGVKCPIRLISSTPQPELNESLIIDENNKLYFGR